LNFIDGLTIWKRICGKHHGENKTCPFSQNSNHTCVTRLSCAYCLPPQQILEIVKQQTLKEIKQKYCNYNLNIDIKSASRSFENVYKQVMFGQDIPFEEGQKILAEIRSVE
jgi:hypothetical protein